MDMGARLKIVRAIQFFPILGIPRGDWKKSEKIGKTKNDPIRGRLQRTSGKWGGGWF